MTEVKYPPFGYNDKLPQASRDVFVILCQELALLQRKWDYYNELFVDLENRRMLQEVAMSTFSVFSDSLLVDILISISRLNDPDNFSNARKGICNVSLQTLVRKNPQIVGLEEQLLVFKNLCCSIEKIRNKRIAHKDYDSTINPKIHTLPKIYKNQIQEVLGSAKQILKMTLAFYDDCDIIFDLQSPGGPKQLLKSWNHRF